QAKAKVDPDVAAVGPAHVRQRLNEGRTAGLPFRIVGGEAAREYADATHPRGLLRPRRQRPRRSRAAEEGKEGAAMDALAHYSMTSVARKWKEGGNSIPSSLAVLRLITKSNLVGCSTGRSAGFSPLRMRPT